jgi:hypothetical protein
MLKIQKLVELFSFTSVLVLGGAAAAHRFGLL